MYNAEHNLRAIKCENLSQSRARQIDLESMIRKKKVVSRVTVVNFHSNSRTLRLHNPCQVTKKKETMHFDLWPATILLLEIYGHKQHFQSIFSYVLNQKNNKQYFLHFSGRRFCLKKEKRKKLFLMFCLLQIEKKERHFALNSRVLRSRV